MRHLPNLLIIGAQKCGTTWLHQRLGLHPDIFMSRDKELRFFSRPQWRDLVDDYAANFAEGGSARYRGESSPNYFWAHNPDMDVWRTRLRNANRDVPGAVRQLLGRDVQLILALRQPVRRAVSAYVHQFRRGAILAGESILEAGRRSSLIDMGRYRRNYAAWEAVYGADGVHTVFLEDIRADGQAVLNGVFDRVGVERMATPLADRPALIGRPLRLEGDILVVEGEQDGDPPLRIRQDELDALQDLYREDIDFVCQRLGAERLGWRRTPELADFARG